MAWLVVNELEKAGEPTERASPRPQVVRHQVQDERGRVLLPPRKPLELLIFAVAFAALYCLNWRSAEAEMRCP